MTLTNYNSCAVRDLVKDTCELYSWRIPKSIFAPINSECTDRTWTLLEAGSRMGRSGIRTRHLSVMIRPLRPILFLKDATTLLDLFILFFKLMSRLSDQKQMYSQPIHLAHEFKLCIQITRERALFNGDSAAKSRCWHRVSNLRPSEPDLPRFAAVPS